MVAALLLAPPPPGPPQTLSGLLDDARGAERAGDAAGAEATLERAAGLYPKSALPRYRLGLLHAAAGRMLEALLALGEAVELEPSRVAPRVALGRLQRDAGSLAPAEAELGKALRLAPGNVEAAKLLASVFLAREAPRRAAELLERARRRHPSDPELLYLLGRARAMELDTDTAEKLYRAAVAADRSFAPAWLALGNLLALRPESAAQALESLERYTALQPNDPAGLLAVGAVRLSLGQTERAVADLRRSIEIEPGRAEARFRLAGALARLGRADEAKREREAFEDIRRREEEGRRRDLAFTTAFRHGQRETQANRLREAAARFREALELRPDSDAARSMLAKVLYSMRDYAGAAEHIALAVERVGSNGEYRYIYGLVLLARGDEGAERELRLAARLAPLIGDSFSQLGHLAARRGDWKQALALYRRAVAVEPEEAGFHGNLARTYEALGDRLSAERHRRRERELASRAAPR